MSTRLEKPTSNQDFFDKAWKWLIIDASPRCVDHNRFCKYRRNNGLEDDTCIAGAFIPDELYARIGSKIEGSNVAHICDPHAGDKHSPELAEIFKAVTPELLKRVQQVHDDPETGPNMERRQEEMRTIAQVCNLQVPQPA